MLIMFTFIKILIASIAIGISLGLAITYFLKKFPSFKNIPIKETSLILITGYLSYMIAELFEFSG